MTPRNVIFDRLDLSLEERAFFTKAYAQPHRHFHTMDHVLSFAEQINSPETQMFPPTMSTAMYWAALFHDVVYDPHRTDNEERSADLMLAMSQYNKYVPGFIQDVVKEMILGTKIVDPAAVVPSYVRKFNKFDRAVLQSDLPGLLAYGAKIYKEYSFVPYMEFVSAHISVVRSLLHPQDTKRIDLYESCLRASQLRVGVYAGSFNPFHKGHLDILQQASAVFDKVILAVGQNPDKGAVGSSFSVQPVLIPGAPLSYETVSFTGTLADLYAHYADIPSYQVSLVRGLRNSVDFNGELTQRHYVQNMSAASIPYTFFVSPSELQYVSSSAIRQLKELGKDVTQYLP